MLPQVSPYLLLIFLQGPKCICMIWGAWVAQSVGCPTSAQLMISQLMGSSPVSGSVLTAQILETASDSVSPSFSAPPPLVLFLKNK